MSQKKKLEITLLLCYFLLSAGMEQNLIKGLSQLLIVALFTVRPLVGWHILIQFSVKIGPQSGEERLVVTDWVMRVIVPDEILDVGLPGSSHWAGGCEANL